MDPNVRKNLLDDINHYHNQQIDKVYKGDQVHRRFAYGTAGFRGDAIKIEPLFYNVGLISALRCLQLGQNVGIMITASHNPVQDNGVKLIDPNGEMLEPEWEAIVEELCNTFNRDDMLNILDKLASRFKIDTRKKTKGSVLIGMDTRPSSKALATLVKRGLETFSSLVELVDYGYITTPTLHYLVAESNKRNTIDLTPKDYYGQLISGLKDIFSRPSNCELYSPNGLVIDCANGVGFETMRNLIIDESFFMYLPLELINVGEGTLNKDCGADYVKTTLNPPTNANEINKRYAALDGDADRVVYFYLENCNSDLKLRLLDGDKIMALYARYLNDILTTNNLDAELSLGVVQTAYANGASTEYLKDQLHLTVDCVDTGVKNLHKQALKYDIGIYFEANGHGTIWISQKARQTIETGGAGLSSLKQLLGVLNNYTGDAISDILMVETILRHYDMNITLWYSLYQDRPNSLIKVEVKDRNKVQTTDAGRICISPVGLQPIIDSLVSQFNPGARCFVRSSGTEDVVRIYSEANQQATADKLAELVGEQVKNVCS